LAQKSGCNYLKKKDLSSESRIPKLDVGGSNPLARFFLTSLDKGLTKFTSLVLFLLPWNLWQFLWLKYLRDKVKNLEFSRQV
jgi:hypothetical protein